VRVSGGGYGVWTMLLMRRLELGIVKEIGMGAMKWILVISLLLAWTPDVPAEQRVALVIGNGAYDDAPLQNPPNDAEAISRALRECGFKVTEKIDADQREIEDAIRAFGKQIQRGGVGLFYYAGHGMQVKGTNYLIPVGTVVEAEDEVKYKAVDAGMVLSKMESAGNRVNIIILDACRNNPFARSFRSVGRGLKRMDAPTGSLLAYATAPGKMADDGTEGNGLYTSMLLKHMKTPGLQIELMLKRVRNDIIEATGGKQVSWESSSLVGDFYFVLQPPEHTLPRLSTDVHEIDMEMVFIPSGYFTMGSKNGNRDEIPVHKVNLDSFYIDVYEVTADHYRACMDAGRCGEPAIGNYCTSGKPSAGDHPVTCVTWYQAEEFCLWAKKRLPTEAEWEKAARGTDERTYPWGEERLSKPNLRGGYGYTSSVGNFPGVSPYGVFGMAGNVWEWVQDNYDSEYYSYGERRNPRGPDEGREKVIRGGSWEDASAALRTSNRNKYPPHMGYFNVGFRCARDAGRRSVLPDNDL
jgi:formylglycine-generating enzyme required for sulfatase activity